MEQSKQPTWFFVWNEGGKWILEVYDAKDFIYQDCFPTDDEAEKYVREHYPNAIEDDGSHSP